jgi:hypothetical protein
MRIRVNPSAMEEHPMPDPTPTPAAPAAAPAAPATPAAPAGTPAAPSTPAATPGAAATPTGATAPAADDKPLGPNGEKALQAERDARKQLEKDIAALAPLKAIADALGSSPAEAKSELEQLNERLSGHEKLLATEREARWRAEIAHAAGMSPEQAAELRGSTKEELQAHAERLKTLFPTTATPGTPKPDPTQGSRGGVELDAQIRAAEEKGDVMESIRLKNLKFAPQ